METSMKALSLVAMAAALLLGAAFVAGQDGPINTTCPIMKGKACKAGVTSTYEGKVIGFC